MQKFSIARISNDRFATERGEIYLRLEPNGNLFWTIHKELASQWDYINAEMEFIARDLNKQNCYLIEAIKTDA